LNKPAVEFLGPGENVPQPEMIVAMLADQRGDYVQKNQGDKPSWFAIGRGFEGNVLLKAFHQGMEVREGVKVWIRSDSFKS
jgi:hypothetical protein